MSQTKALNKLLSDIPFFYEKEGQYVLQVVHVIPAVRAALQKVKVQGLPREQRHFVLISALIAALENLPKCGNSADWASLLAYLREKKALYAEEASCRFDRDQADRLASGKVVEEGEFVGALFPELSQQRNDKATKVINQQTHPFLAASSSESVAGTVLRRRGRPKLSDMERAETVTFQIPKKIRILLDMAANREDLSSSALIRKAVLQYLGISA